MDLHNEIKKLSETVSSQKLRVYFLWALEQPATTIDEKKYITDILVELSDKQWHNYEVLEPTLRNKIDQFMTLMLQGNISVSLIKNISGIIGRLGLVNSYERYKTMVYDKLPDEIRKEISDTINEFGESIQNPYSL